MSEITAESSIGFALELLQDCAREAAATASAEDLSEHVMVLFRNEDMDGIAALMKRTRMEREFLTDLQAFIAKWGTRVQAVRHTSQPE